MSLSGCKKPEIVKIIDVTQLRQEIVERIYNQQQEQKKRFDKTRFNPKSLKVNDLVLIRVTSLPATGKSRKLLPKWKGPFRISKVVGNDRYEVCEIKGSRRSRIPYLGVAGIENIKPWVRFSDNVQ